MLAQEVSGVGRPTDEGEQEHIGHGSLMDMMEWAVDDRLIVSKHTRLFPDRDTRITEGGEELNNLIHTDASCNQLRAIGGGFHCSLLLGVQADGSLVEEVEGATSQWELGRGGEGYP